MKQKLLAWTGTTQTDMNIYFLLIRKAPPCHTAWSALTLSQILDWSNLKAFADDKLTLY